MMERSISTSSLFYNFTMFTILLLIITIYLPFRYRQIRHAPTTWIIPSPNITLIVVRHIRLFRNTVMDQSSSWKYNPIETLTKMMVGVIS